MMDSALGSLSRLPPELRDQIFIECIANRSIGLLMTCKRLHSELKCHLWEMFTLKLHIDPSDPVSMINIVQQPYRPWGSGRNRVYVKSPHPYLEAAPITDMPLSSFRRIRILVDAPDSDDPGQVMRIFKSVSRLVKILSPTWYSKNEVPEIDESIVHVTGASSQGLPSIEVVLRDTPLATWSSAGQWHQTLQSYSKWVDKDEDGVGLSTGELEDAVLDVEFAVHPLMRLRNVKSLDVRLPKESPQEPRLASLISNIQRLTLSKVHFGLNWDEEVENMISDDVIHMFESCNFLWLDYLLDDLHGPTADQLRNERAQTSCREYELQFHHSIWGPINNGPRFIIGEGGAYERFDRKLIDELQTSFSLRWWDHWWRASADEYEFPDEERLIAYEPFIRVLRWETRMEGDRWESLVTCCVDCHKEFKMIHKARRMAFNRRV